MIQLLLSRWGLVANREWKEFFFKWMGIALLLHMIGAIFSAGFYHADEHFQIIEFMNYKLGRIPVSELPLEFGHAIRPWLQPAILTGMTQLLNILGVDSPFNLALSFRILSSLLGWLSLCGLTANCALWFKEE